MYLKTPQVLRFVEFRSFLLLSSGLPFTYPCSFSRTLPCTNQNTPAMVLLLEAQYGKLLLQWYGTSNSWRTMCRDPSLWNCHLTFCTSACIWDNERCKPHCCSYPCDFRPLFQMSESIFMPKPSCHLWNVLSEWHRSKQVSFGYSLCQHPGHL